MLISGNLANTGLGKEAVLQFAKHNPSKIYLAARTQSKAEAAISEVQAEVPNAKISFLPLDLTSFSSIGEAAKKFQSESSRLDILMNNAGIMAVPPGKTAEGFEIQFGTNHIGHFLLTKLLLPTLIKTSEEPGADVRIINLSSEGHRFAPSGGIQFDQLEGPNNQGPWELYGQSKLANILFTRELARRYPGIKSVAVHPGLIKTDLYIPSEQSNFLLRYAKAFFQPLLMRDIKYGTKNQLWASVANVQNGAYYTPIASKGSGTKYANDDKLAKKLWDWSEDALKKHGY